LCQLIYREPARVQQRLQQLRHQKRISRTKQWRSPVGLHRSSEFFTFTLEIWRLYNWPPDTCPHLSHIWAAETKLHWPSLSVTTKKHPHTAWMKENFDCGTQKWKRVTLSRTCLRLTSFFQQRFPHFQKFLEMLKCLWSLWWKIWPGGKIASQSTCSRCVKLRLLSTPLTPALDWLKVYYLLLLQQRKETSYPFAHFGFICLTNKLNGKKNRLCRKWLEAGRNVRDTFELCHFSSYSLVSESSILNEKHLKSWPFQEKIADLGNTICSISINHKNTKWPQGHIFFIIDKCVWQPTFCDVTR